MSPKVSNQSKIVSAYEYMRLHILLSILAFMVVAGSIIIYQINKVDKTAPPVSKEGYTELTAQQREKILEDLKETFSKSPPLTASQRGKILKELKDGLATQYK